MTSRTRIVSKFAISGLILAMSATVLAVDNPSQGTPGWKYGGRNCGCLTNVNATALSCQLCCNSAAHDGSLPAADVSDCIAFCLQAHFPCLPDQPAVPG